MKPETAKELDRIGVRLGPGVRWKRLPEATDRKVMFASFVCRCEERVIGWDMVPLYHAGRLVLIGQCGRCQRITWCDWRGGEWLGAAKLSGEPIVIGPQLPVTVHHAGG